jgi:hypothetical protein
MSESAEYYESNWQPNVDFAAEQRRFQEDATRRAQEMREKTGREQAKEVERLLPRSLRTNSPTPLVMIWDGTGSVGETPGVIAGKAIFFCHEVTTTYLGKEAEVSFGSFGDVLNRQGQRSDEKYPLQARPFAKGGALTTRLGEIVIEGKGGGQQYESIELILLYYARNVHMPNVAPGKKVPLILMTDERARPSVSQEYAALVHTQLEGAIISTSDIFHELNDRFSVYLVLQPYTINGSDNDPDNRMIREDWENYLPKERIAHLYDRQRIMDISLGILAKETGRVDEFWKELKERQTPEQVTMVERGLRDVLPKDATKAPRRKKPAKGQQDIGESKLHEPLTGDDVADLI